MKKSAILIGFILCTTILFSQDRDYEKIKALKVGYLTEQLELTSTEAEAFWPVYNAYDASHSAFRDEERNLMRDDTAIINGLSEKEAKNIIEKLRTLEKKKVRAQEEYVGNLEKVLSFKKILMLFRSEKDFRRKLLHRLRNEKNQNRPR